MLRQGYEVFLDDMTVCELQEALRVPIKIVHGPADIISAAIGDVEEQEIS